MIVDVVFLWSGLVVYCYNLITYLGNLGWRGITICLGVVGCLFRFGLGILIIACCFMFVFLC